MSEFEKRDDKPILRRVCEWCGTALRSSIKGCPRGPACAAESAEHDRLTKLVEAAPRDSQDHKWRA